MYSLVKIGAIRVYMSRQNSNQLVLHMFTLMYNAQAKKLHIGRISVIHGIEFELLVVSLKSSVKVNQW